MVQFSHIYDYIKHAHFYKPGSSSGRANRHGHASHGTNRHDSMSHGANRHDFMSHGANSLRDGLNAVRESGNSMPGRDHALLEGLNPGLSSTKPSSIASEFANSDYSGPDPAYSVYKVPPPPRPLPGSPTTLPGPRPVIPGSPPALPGLRPVIPGSPPAKSGGNYLNMTGSNSNTPSPSQVILYINLLIYVAFILVSNRQ